MPGELLNRQHPFRRKMRQNPCPRRLVVHFRVFTMTMRWNLRRFTAGFVALAVLLLGSPSHSADDKDEKQDAPFAESLGIKMVQIKPGSFMMGSSAEQIAMHLNHDAKAKAEDYANEQPAHKVEITRQFSLSAHEITVGQFRQFVEDTKYKTDAELNGLGGLGYDAEGENQQGPEFNWKNVGYEQTDQHPVSNLSWNDAVAFCDWLTRKEGLDAVYRLPTEAEWEYACRAGTDTLYPNGDDPEEQVRIGNVADVSCVQKCPGWKVIDASDGVVFTAPVGSFAPNAWGLYDMIGNVSEWCLDGYEESYYQRSPAEDPFETPESAPFRALHGGSFRLKYCRSASRFFTQPWMLLNDVGFRVVRVLAQNDVRNQTRDGNAPQPLTDSNEKPTRPLKESLGIKMVEIKPGSFQRGSTDRQISMLLKLFPDLEPDDYEQERPALTVKMTRAFSLSAHEITVGQFRQFVEETKYKTQGEYNGVGGYGFVPTTFAFEQKVEYTWKNPGYSQKDDHPVVNVTWHDASAFCLWLTRKEGQTAYYRLPTEAEWEYACRAGSDTLYPGGDDPEGLVSIANIADSALQRKFPDLVRTVEANDGFVFTAPVGSRKPNRWGIYDMIGNVREWCLDSYDEDFHRRSPKQYSQVRWSLSPISTFRGGSWADDGSEGRCAFRYGMDKETPYCLVGFRVVRVPLKD